MTVFVGAVKDKLATFQTLNDELGDPELADANDLATVAKALGDLNVELDVRIDELDDEIGSEVALSSFALPSGAFPVDTSAHLLAESANVDQMTRLLDSKAYAGRLAALFAQVAP